MYARFTSRPIHGANDVGGHGILLKSPYRAYHALNSGGIPSATAKTHHPNRTVSTAINTNPPKLPKTHSADSHMALVLVMVSSPLER